MSEFASDGIEKVHQPPLCHDSTLPLASDDDDADTKTGVLIAVVGVPFDGAVPTYDAALGYCIWIAPGPSGTPVTVDDGMGGFAIVFDEDGEVVYA